MTGVQTCALPIYTSLERVLRGEKDSVVRSGQGGVGSGGEGGEVGGGRGFPWSFLVEMRMKKVV